MNEKILEKIQDVPEEIVAAHPFLDGHVIFTKHAVYLCYVKGSKLERYGATKDSSLGKSQTEPEAK